jgi:hypothetical protein
MQVAQQRRVIAISAMVTFTLGFLGAAHKNETPSARFLIGIGFTFTFVSVFADLGAGDMAAAFAILIMIGALLYEGQDLIGLLTERANGKVKVSKATKSKTGKPAKAGAAEGLEGIEGGEGGEAPTNTGTTVTSMQHSQRLTRAQRLRR